MIVIPKNKVTKENGKLKTEAEVISTILDENNYWLLSKTKSINKKMRTIQNKEYYYIVIGEKRPIFKQVELYH
jgi:hypothetical protein